MTTQRQPAPDPGPPPSEALLEFVRRLAHWAAEVDSPPATTSPPAPR